MSRIVKQQRRYGSEWYLENDEGKVAWVAPMVKEHIERLEAENKELREEVELVGHIAESNVVASIGREESLEDENAKLRKYVRELLRVVKLGEIDCGACRHFDECYAGDAMDFAPENCRLVVYARELGIEVPE